MEERATFSSPQLNKKKSPFEIYPWRHVKTTKIGSIIDLSDLVFELGLTFRSDNYVYV